MVSIGLTRQRRLKKIWYHKVAKRSSNVRKSFISNFSFFLICFRIDLRNVGRCLWNLHDKEDLKVYGVTNLLNDHPRSKTFRTLDDHLTNLFP